MKGGFGPKSRRAAPPLTATLFPVAGVCALCNKTEASRVDIVPRSQFKQNTVCESVYFNWI